MSDSQFPAYGVRHRDGRDTDAIVRDLRATNWLVYVLDGSPTTEAGFVEVIRRALPLDPPINRIVRDAIEDSLWEGLYQLNAEKIAIVWPGYARLRDGDPGAFSNAYAILAELVFSLADPEATAGRVTRLLILLI